MLPNCMVPWQTSCLQSPVLWFLIWCSLGPNDWIRRKHSSIHNESKGILFKNKTHPFILQSWTVSCFLLTVQKGWNKKTQSISLFRAGTPGRLSVLSEVVVQSDPQCPWFLCSMSFKVYHHWLKHTEISWEKWWEKKKKTQSSPLPKLNIAAEKLPKPYRKGKRLPTTNFEG